MNWQNFKDDVYAHWNRIRYVSGAVALGIAFVISSALVVASLATTIPKPETGPLLMVGSFVSVLLVGWAFVNFVPYGVVEKRNAIRYRYTVYLDGSEGLSKTQMKIAEFAEKHEMTFRCLGRTEKASERGKNFLEYQVTRLDHATLLTMRF